MKTMVMESSKDENTAFNASVTASNVMLNEQAQMELLAQSRQTLPQVKDATSLQQNFEQSPYWKYNDAVRSQINAVKEDARL